MLSLPPSIRIFLCTADVDLRKSFDGLALMVRQFLGGDPLSGHLFVFRNKRRDRLKLLYWDGDGLAIWYKNQVSVCTHRLPFTEFVEYDHNLARRPAQACGMDASPSSERSRR
jgi:transposase